MKKMVSVLTFCFGLFFTGSVFAESHSTAIVDVMSILQQMPQTQTVQKSLKTEFDARAKSLQTDEKSANNAAQKLKKDGMTLSASEKTKLSNIIKGFQDKANQLSEDYRQRQNEETNKLLIVIQNAVKQIAQKEKYDVVLKAEAVFYVDNAVNITSKVLEKVKTVQVKN